MLEIVKFEKRHCYFMYIKNQMHPGTQYVIFEVIFAENTFAPTCYAYVLLPNCTVLFVYIRILQYVCSVSSTKSL
jgi:hypothetical protein